MSEKNNQIEAVDDQQIGPTSEQIARFAEANVDMTRRDLFDFSKKAAMALVAAKIVSLIPAESRARREEDEEFPEYTADNFTKVMWQELDPENANTSSLRTIDSAGLERPLLAYAHNVKGKIKDKKGNNIPTPSLVFELSKFCLERSKEKEKAVLDRKKTLENFKDVAHGMHPDYKKIMTFYKTAKEISNSNMKTWKPLAARSSAVMKKVQKMVMTEKSFANKYKYASGANEKIPNVQTIIPTKEIERNDSFEPLHEVLSWTRPYVYNCVTAASYNEGPRPQTDVKLLEGMFMLKNVATVLYEAAYQRHKAFVDIKSFADKPDTPKKKKKQLYRIAPTKTSRSIRDKWASLIIEITAMIKIMIAAYTKETALASKIKRCRPSERPDEQPYLDKALERIEPQIHSGVHTAPDTSSPSSPSGTSEEPAEEIEDVPETWYLD